MTLSVIVLAAGASSRMGRAKQLLPIAGTAMLRRVVMTVLATTADNTVVVLGRDNEAHRQVVADLNVNIIANKNWELGIGNSLKAGLAHAVFLEPKTEAVLVMLADQPAITTDQLNTIIESYKETLAPVVASVYSGIPGVPALFGKNVFDELLSLDDKTGAKAIIEGHIHQAKLIDIPEGAIDIDTPDDYRAFPGSESL